jgi:hypothetical protein
MNSTRHLYFGACLATQRSLSVGFRANSCGRCSGDLRFHRSIAPLEEAMCSDADANEGWAAGRLYNGLQLGYGVALWLMEWFRARGIVLNLTLASS